MSRSVIVTGGFGELGHCVASGFAAQGDKVTRVDFASAAPVPIEGVLDLGGIDLTDAEAASAVVDRVKVRFGSLDILVNVAGGFTWETLGDGSIETWTRMFAMNALTCVTMTKVALPAMLEVQAARIINIGASGAIVATAGMGGYAASKSAVHKLTESLAAELNGADITVNAILPSIIDTPTNRADMPEADFASWVKPSAIVDVILFLASPAARAISGALVPVTHSSGAG